jgi:hypothetical protein
MITVLTPSPIFLSHERYGYVRRNVR